MMKRLIFVLAVASLSASAAFETSTDPKPPYPAGSTVNVTVSGGGVDQLRDYAYFQLVGAGPSDFLPQESQVEKTDGPPPAFKFSFKAPQYSNTLEPKLRFHVNYLNGVQETMDPTNTPAFKDISFTGITLDDKPPEFSNFQFKETAPGAGVFEFDATDASGIESLGGNLEIGRKSGWFGSTEYGATYATTFTECSGSAPKLHCVTTATYPPGAEGELLFRVGIADGAGNRIDIEKSFPHQATVKDPNPPGIEWPATATVCGDSINVEFKMKGGDGLFQGFTDFWSVNEPTRNSTTGIASHGEVECAPDGSCFSMMEMPRLEALEKGSLNVDVNGQSTGTEIGGIVSETEFRIKLDGNNGKNTKIILPPAAVAEILKPRKERECNVVSLGADSAKQTGTVEEPATSNR